MSNKFRIFQGSLKHLIEEKIIFNKTVKRISWDRVPAEVLCTDGQVFIADQVLVTVPLGVLKENVNTLFVPPVPEKKLQAIKVHFLY